MHAWKLDEGPWGHAALDCASGGLTCLRAFLPPQGTIFPWEKPEVTSVKIEANATAEEGRLACGIPYAVQIRTLYYSVGESLPYTLLKAYHYDA